MGVEVTGGMEWLLWLIEKTEWMLTPTGIFLVVGVLVVCVLEFKLRRPVK